MSDTSHDDAPTGAVMTLQLRRPLVAFDLETTGLNVDEDRIVEISCVKIHPDGRREVRTKRLNPERPISAEAAAVHGIQDADVAHEPAFRQIARGLYQFLEGCDLTGFNMRSFDLPMLKKEFLRCECRFPTAGTRIIDTRSIYLSQEPRSLASAYQLYCGRTLQDAHSAEADAVAAADILMAQVARYDDLPGDLEELDLYCHPDKADWIDEDGKVLWKDDEPALGFGKYRGRPLRELVIEDSEYLDWILSADFDSRVHAVIADAMRGEFWKRPPPEELDDNAGDAPDSRAPDIGSPHISGPNVSAPNEPTSIAPRETAESADSDEPDPGAPQQPEAA